MVQQQLARRGIADTRVLQAMRSVPREDFLPSQDADFAYADGAQPIDCGQTISQPFMVARMTELLELHPTDRVLEIGTGSGYQTAVLAALAAEVCTVEWHLKLLTAAADRLAQLGIANVRYRCGDGSLGWPAEAPFDAILVTAGAPQVPAPLQAQLADDGRLVAPIGPLGEQTLVRIRRRGEQFVSENLLLCRFVKLLGAAGWTD